MFFGAVGVTQERVVVLQVRVVVLQGCVVWLFCGRHVLPFLDAGTLRFIF